MIDKDSDLIEYWLDFEANMQEVYCYSHTLEKFIFVNDEVFKRLPW